MEPRPLARALALLLSIVSGFMAACMAVGLALGEGAAAVHAFALPVAAGLCFLVLVLATGRKRDKPALSTKTGYLFVTLGWTLSGVLGALPFVLSGSIPSFVDALFETISGLTTTGATVLSDIESLPDSILLWRATTHWLGGMGIVVLTVAVFPLLGMGGRALMEAEAPGPQVDKFTPRISETAKILWLIYLGLTVLETVLLMLGGLDLLDAVTHSFATMATGGFSTRNQSVGAFGSGYVDWVVTVFMVLAGMNFSLHWRMLRGDFKAVFKNSEFVTYILIFVASSGVMALDLMRGGAYQGFGQALRYSAFQTSSILTTTGFVTADYLAWPALSQAILFALMFIGGCAGSTGGGIKVGRIVTLFKMGLSEMRYLLNPRGIYGVYVDGHYLKKNVVYDIAAMVFLYAAAIIVSTLVVASGGYDIQTSITATLATLGNIGPGFALVGPVFNYDFFPDCVTAWLSFVMLLGRLEIYTVLVLFTRSFWKR